MKSILLSFVLIFLVSTSSHSQTPRIDVVFLLDATGSMADEIAVVKGKIRDIITEISLGDPAPDVRFGIVAYRDRGDEYVTRSFPLTRDLDSIVENLESIEAAGGGDYEESLNEALHVAINQMNWDLGPQTVKIIFLIADAPPHTDYPDDYDYWDEIPIALEKFIIVYAIGASGLSEEGERIFTEIAEGTEGTFQWLTYQREFVDSEGDTVLVTTKGRETSYTKGDSTWIPSEGEVIFAGEGPGEGDVVTVGGEPGRGGDTGTGGGGTAVGTAVNNLEALVTETIKRQAKEKGVEYEDPTAVEEETDTGTSIPELFTLGDNFPNPFNPATVIPFTIASSYGFSIRYELSVYDILGKKVKTLFEGGLSPGEYTVGWDGTDDGGRQVSSGIYLYRLSAVNGSFLQVKKMTLAR